MDEAPTMNRDAGIGLLRRSSIITRTALRSGWFALGRGSAGGCGAVPKTSRSSGWSEKSWSSASSTRCSSPPSRNWRTRSHAQCGPESRPDIDTSCDTSSSNQPQVR